MGFSMANGSHGDLVALEGWRSETLRNQRSPVADLQPPVQEPHQRLLPRTPSAAATRSERSSSTASPRRCRSRNSRPAIGYRFCGARGSLCGRLAKPAGTPTRSPLGQRPPSPTRRQAARSAPPRTAAGCAARAAAGTSSTGRARCAGRRRAAAACAPRHRAGRARASPLPAGTARAGSSRSRPRTDRCARAAGRRTRRGHSRGRPRGSAPARSSGRGSPGMRRWGRRSLRARSDSSRASS